MTEEEDALNATKNEVVRQCQHQPVKEEGKGWHCVLCGCRFAVLLFPRKHRFPPYDFDNEDQ